MVAPGEKVKNPRKKCFSGQKAFANKQPSKKKRKSYQYLSALQKKLLVSQFGRSKNKQQFAKSKGIPIKTLRHWAGQIDNLLFGHHQQVGRKPNINSDAFQQLGDEVKRRDSLKLSCNKKEIGELIKEARIKTAADRNLVPLDPRPTPHDFKKLKELTKEREPDRTTVARQQAESDVRNALSLIGVAHEVQDIDRPYPIQPCLTANTDATTFVTRQDGGKVLVHIDTTHASRPGPSGLEQRVKVLFTSFANGYFLNPFIFLKCDSIGEGDVPVIKKIYGLTQDVTPGSYGFIRLANSRV
jgi:hypothetical protein